jgi:hypothetical protein
LAHLSDLVGFGFAVSGGLQIDDFLNPFPVKDAVATLSRAFTKSKLLQKRAKVIQAEILFLPNGEQLGFELIPFGHWSYSQQTTARAGQVNGGTQAVSRKRD